MNCICLKGNAIWKRSVTHFARTLSTCNSDCANCALKFHCNNLNSVASSSIDPTARAVYIKSFGCSHNMSDGEYMGGILKQGGYNITNEKELADVWIINTCTVRDKSVSSFENLYKEAQQRNIPVVIAGCMTEADKDLKKKYSNNAIVGVTQIDKIKEVVDSVLSSCKPAYVPPKSDSMPSLSLPKVRKDSSVEIIPISLGCKGACTFCQTRLARGELRSYPISEIVNRVHACKLNHTAEIWLTSEDTGAYGIDLGTNLISLLSAVKEEIKDSNIMIKIGMSNPPFLLPFLPQITSFLLHKNFYAYLHIPVQSGSNEVLKKMNRKYKIDDFCGITKFFQKSVPGVTISTDVIVGFPYETKSDFESTLETLQKLHLDVVHYSRYYARPHTIAAKYEQIPLVEAKSRVKILSDWFKGLHPYDWMVGKYMAVWVSAEKTGEFRCSHTKEYVKVLFKEGNPVSTNSVMLVRCVSAARFHVNAEVIEELGTLKQEYVAPRDLIADDAESVKKFF